MKRLLILLVLLIPSVGLAQTAEQDTVKVSAIDLERYFQAVDSLRQENATLQERLNNILGQNNILRFMIDQDSTLMLYKNRQISLLESEIQVHERRIKYLSNEDWRKYLWFLGGAFTIYIASVVVNNVEN